MLGVQLIQSSLALNQSLLGTSIPKEHFVVPVRSSHAALICRVFVCRSEVSYA